MLNLIEILQVGVATSKLFEITSLYTFRRIGVRKKLNLNNYESQDPLATPKKINDLLIEL